MAKGDTVLLTQAEYARHRKALNLSGGTRESVRKAVDRKSISVFGDGLIDPELADIQWARNIRARVSAPNADSPGTDLATQATAVQADAPAAGLPSPAPASQLPSGYNEARARREAADAETAEINLKKLRGEVLITADVARAGFEIGREIRDAMESSINSLAAELAPLPTAEACGEVLRKHNRAMQDLWAKAFREKIGTLPATLS